MYLMRAVLTNKFLRHDRCELPLRISPFREQLNHRLHLLSRRRELEELLPDGVAHLLRRLGEDWLLSYAVAHELEQLVKASDAHLR